MPTPTPPIRGLLGIEHIGLTVPDMEQALGFFREVLGAETLYEIGPLRAEDHWMAVNLGVDPAAVIERLVMLRIGQGPALELFEYAHHEASPAAERDARHPPPQNAVGGAHLAFRVEDIDVCVDALRAHGLLVLGEVKRVTDGPSAGLAWVHFLAPWGQQLELVNHANGVVASAAVAPAAGGPGSENAPPQGDPGGVTEVG